MPGLCALCAFAVQNMPGFVPFVCFVAKKDAPRPLLYNGRYDSFF
jgi:hypothetical protein